MLTSCCKLSSINGLIVAAVADDETSQDSFLGYCGRSYEIMSIDEVQINILLSTNDNSSPENNTGLYLGNGTSRIVNSHHPTALTRCREERYEGGNNYRRR